MVVNFKNQPLKKSDQELMRLLENKISNGDYIFLKHAKQRLKDRCISDIEVLDILEGKIGRKRKRHKMKDRYHFGNYDWNYCIEGVNLDRAKIRIIFSFSVDLLLIITVIKLH